MIGSRRRKIEEKNMKKNLCLCICFSKNDSIEMSFEFRSKAHKIHQDSNYTFYYLHKNSLPSSFLILYWIIFYRIAFKWVDYLKIATASAVLYLQLVAKIR